MSQQTMNLRRAFTLVARNKVVVGVIVAVGLIVGIGIAVISPVGKTGSALVILPTSKVTTQTFEVIATSDPVLSAALPKITPAPASIVTLRQKVTATSPSENDRPSVGLM